MKGLKGYVWGAAFTILVIVLIKHFGAGKPGVGALANAL